MELYSVIKNDGPPGLLFWKFTGEDFRTGSQLIVAENEEALFVKDGVIVETFSGGKFDLKTNNYPFIDRLRSALSGGVSAFNCKVFFVSTSPALEIKWGTDSPVQVRDPVYQIMTSVQGRGSYAVKVAEAKKFVLKFVANNTQAVTSDMVSAQFRSVFGQKIKTAIASGIREAGREVLGIVERLDEFAGQLQPIMAPVMDEYGLELVGFYVAALDIPQNDPSRQKLEAAFANRAELGVLGGDWQRVQARDIMRDAAQNPSGVAGAGLGLGVGVAAGGAMAPLAAAMFAPAAAQVAPPPSAPPPVSVSVECPACHHQSPAGVKFCGGCGVPLPVGKKCAKCGAELQPGAKFCGECGTPAAQKCAKCGAELQPGVKFCGECGTKNG